jgi:hypothetical protein
LLLRAIALVLAASTPFAAREAFARDSGELTYFIYPSAKEVDWSSPATALLSTGVGMADSLITGLFYPERVKSMLGHVAVRFRCTDDSGKEHLVWSGLTGQNDVGETRRDLLQDQIGYGVLFKTYTDGIIEEDDVARNHVARFMGRLEHGRRLTPLFARFRVPSGEDCSKIVDFHEAFSARSGKDLLYGFKLHTFESYKAWQEAGRDPRVPLGGGCTSLAVGYLKVLGVFEPLFEEMWTKTLTISERWLGVPGVRRVPLADLLKADRWSVAGYADRSLEIFDTERMWDFLDGLRGCALLLDGRPAGASARNCDPRLKDWVRANRGRLNADARTLVRGDFTRTIPGSSNPKGPQIPSRRESYTRDVERLGVDFN